MNILFVINNMHIGGTRASLLSLLSELEKVPSLRINVLVLSHEGELMDRIPQFAGLLPSDGLLHAVFSLRNELKGIREVLLRGIVHTLRVLIGYRRVYPWIYRCAAARLKGRRFDAVIGYQQGDACDMASFIPASRHILWIHSPYSSLLAAREYFELPSSYRKADRILFVAESGRQDFTDHHPEYTEKCEVIRNTIDPDRIRSLSAEGGSAFAAPRDRLRLVTVGRASAEKGYERLIAAAKMLRDQGCRFEWVVVGGGTELGSLRRLCTDTGVDDCVYLIGAKQNPYPFIAAADAFVLTSYYESQPLVLIESLLLEVPFVTTSFPSCTELTQGKDYSIVTENSTEGIARGVKQLFDPARLAGMRLAAKGYSYDNSEPVDRFLKVCGYGFED